MGGGHEIGNVTPSAEFNIWADPEAAALVFAAGFRKITLVPLDATHKAVISIAAVQDTARFQAGRRRRPRPFSSRSASKAIAATSFSAGKDAAPVHDALCVASLIEPDIIETQRLLCRCRDGRDG